MSTQKSVEKGIKVERALFKVLILALLFLLAVIMFTWAGMVMKAHAQDLTLHLPDQDTIMWDPCTTLDTGGPLPAGDTVTYRVYLSHDGLLPAGAPVEISETVYTINFSPGEALWFAGVSGVRNPAGTTFKLESAITWSNSTNTDLVPEGPFGWHTYHALQLIGGLKTKPPL